MLGTIRIVKLAFLMLYNCKTTYKLLICYQKYCIAYYKGSEVHCFELVDVYLSPGEQ